MLQPYNKNLCEGMTWYAINCKECQNEEEIGIYFPDYYDHSPQYMPNWTIEVVCSDCLKAPE